MKEMRNDPTDRLICATLLAALMPTGFGFVIRTLLTDAVGSLALIGKPGCPNEVAAS